MWSRIVRTKPLAKRQLNGLKYLDRLTPMLDALHEVGCERDKAGNRKLHYDQYVMFILLAMFNPVVRTLRGLQQASTLSSVQRRLGTARTSLGALSEATDIFDPTRLEGIIGTLLAEVPRAKSILPDAVPHVLTAVDGSIVTTIATLAQAAFLRDESGGVHCGWWFHTHFEIDRAVPVRMEVTSALPSGPGNEKTHLKRRLEPDRCYVLDRGYLEFALFNAIVHAKSSYICRIRDNSRMTPLAEERPVTEAARAAGVLADRVMKHMGVSVPTDHPVRVVFVETTPHQRRGGHKGDQSGPPSDGILRIATNLLDVPAEIIAESYRRRWQIELFFRFFKHMLGCRHLLSHSSVGIQIQAYCAIITYLLIHLWTGGRPTIRTFEMVFHYLTGLATRDELRDHLAQVVASKKPN